jgi:hypothetical protein
MDVGLKTALLAILGVGSLVLTLLGVLAATSGHRRRKRRVGGAPMTPGDAAPGSVRREARG